MADLAVEQTPVVRRRLRIALPGRHVVYIRAVKCGDDGHDTRHAVGHRDIHRIHIGMGVRATHHGQCTGASFDAVFHIGFPSRHQLTPVDFGFDLADVGEVVTELRSDHTAVVAKIARLASQTDCKEVQLVTGVADEQAGEHVADLVSRRMRFSLEQPSQQQSRLWGIVGILDHSGIDHRLLDIIQGPVDGQAVGGPDSLTIDLGGQHQVGEHGHVIDDYRIATGKTFPIVAVTHRYTP